ncbi:MAG: ATP synthase F0 subunit C [Bacteroidales bacterium]|nr:ATP synthase F0 subunit C [Bacteroidales bacterium]
MLSSILLAAEAFATSIVTIGVALVVIGAAFGIGKLGTSAMEAIARQPQAANDIRMSMILVAALIEGATLFGIVVCLLAL